MVFYMTAGDILVISNNTCRNSTLFLFVRTPQCLSLFEEEAGQVFDYNPTNGEVFDLKEQFL